MLVFWGRADFGGDNPIKYGARRIFCHLGQVMDSDVHLCEGARRSGFAPQVENVTDRVGVVELRIYKNMSYQFHGMVSYKTMPVFQGSPGERREMASWHRP